MEIVSKILELLSKPLHFLIIGLFILGWGLWVQPSLDYVFYGILFILIASCTFIDKQFKKYQTKKDVEAQKTKDNEKREKIRQQIINKYENMPKDDRYIIDECLKANYPVFKNNYSISDSSIHSLHSQGWGAGNGYIFTIKSEYFNILQEYKKEQKSFQKRNNERKK